MQESSTKSKRLGVLLASGYSAIWLVLSGCATHDARTHLQSVAKDWCETIRASQVIPVYPLTQDVIVGDVYLVQTPIADQEKEYESHGFLPLDDHQVRLPYTNFTNMYFDGYWQDEFGKTPHPMQTYTNVAAGNDTVSNFLTSATAPRAAFPTYSFQAQAGFGLSAAFPIEGIPVALGFLGSDQVNGSVTIVDAYTYAGDEDGLLSQLRNWAQNSNVRFRLSQTAKMAAPTRVYLRVVSRVYLARAVEVSLQKASSEGGSAQAGNVSSLSLLSTNGAVNPNYTNLLNALNNSQSSLAGLVGGATQVGGAVKFVSASGSSVGLSQSFDRLLTIGYLGFDVSVNTNGDLGYAPIPTFLRLNGKIKDAPAADVVGPLTIDEARFKTSEIAFKSLAQSNPVNAANLMQEVVKTLASSEFSAVANLLQATNLASLTQAAINNLISQFETASINYVSVNGGSGERYSLYDEAFTQAFRDHE